MKLLQAKNKIFLFLFLISVFEVLGQPVPPKMRRVCRQITENNLYFFPATNLGSCTSGSEYQIWGRNGSAGIWGLIDAIVVPNPADPHPDFYQHVGANPIGTPTNWEYFILFSCVPVIGGFHSDTMVVDETPPDTLFLDSVSVDILTNKVQIGWRKNPSPDFYRYLVYFDNNGVWTEVTNSILTDTFMVDTNAVLNPRLTPIKYDITSKDSCDTRAQVFNINPHTTIHLSGSADTCNKTAYLYWRHYRGWSKIRSYYIFQQTNSGGYQLIDSVSGVQNSYNLSIVLGDINDFFIRAYKDTSIAVSSTSSLLTLQTRYRKEPENTLLTNISVINPDENGMTATFVVQNNEESKTAGLFYDRENSRGVFNFTPPVAAYPLGVNDIVFNSPYKTEKLYYKIKSYNLCDDEYEGSVVMPQIVVKADIKGDENIITWNRHFGWDTDVELYRIYRGTDDDFGVRSYQLIDSVPPTDTTYSDTNLLDKIGSFGLCYYVEAVQNGGSPTGLKSVAKSFSSCALGEMKVFVPNAFNPYGYNKFFRPEGSYIDYVNSSLEIFDRWGGKVIEKKDIANGWDGRDASGNMCSDGVYFYKLILVSPNGKQQKKSGFVTLLY